MKFRSEGNKLKNELLQLSLSIRARKSVRLQSGYTGYSYNPATSIRAIKSVRLHCPATINVKKIYIPLAMYPKGSDIA